MSHTSRLFIPVFGILLFTAQNALAAPRLGVLIVLDQFCAEHVTRYAHVFGNGLKRLLREGVLYADAHHDHAMTLTATGHASLATGSYPSRHGVVGNNWVDRASGQRVYSTSDSTTHILGDPEAGGQSPRSLMTSAIGDWLKAQHPRARVYSVSQKDRSAIMLGGQRPDGVYWFEPARGVFVTSSYYMDTLPEWVSKFDCFPYRELAVREGWRKVASDETYRLANEDDFPAENDGVRTTFPHLYDSAAAVAQTPSEWLLETPFGDQMILDFARQLVISDSLGTDSVPDLLCISLSAVDYIGHSYGPFSQEVLDALLRADDELGEFLHSLDSLVGIGQFTVVLSSDHGVMPLPEELVQSGQKAERILRADANLHFETAARHVAEAAGITAPLITGYTNGLTLDTKAGEARGIRPPDLRQAVASAIARIDYIDDVMTFEELVNNEHGGGYREMYRHSFHPDRAPDIAYRVKENILILGSKFGTTHGTPYRYDTHIPLIFWGAGVKSAARPVEDRVRTIDVAPTLADLLGIILPSGIDGVVLRDALADANRED